MILNYASFISDHTDFNFYKIFHISFVCFCLSRSSLLDFRIGQIIVRGIMKLGIGLERTNPCSWGI